MHDFISLTIFVPGIHQSPTHRYLTCFSSSKYYFWHYWIQCQAHLWHGVSLFIIFLQMLQKLELNSVLPLQNIDVFCTLMFPTTGVSLVWIVNYYVLRGSRHSSVIINPLKPEERKRGKIGRYIRSRWPYIHIRPWNLFSVSAVLACVGVQENNLLILVR
jgi:hypothetical protein